MMSGMDILNLSTRPPFPLLALAALVGCSGGGQTGTLSPRPGPSGILCPALALAGPAMLAPKPGATAVPTTLAMLTFDTLPVSGQMLRGQATLTGNDGSTITSGTLTRSSDGSTITASLPGLHAQTTYAVSISGTLVDSDGCGIPFAADDGSFTTR
jgi:hypothetical protein